MNRGIVASLAVVIGASATAAFGAAFYEPFNTLGQLEGQTASNGKVWFRAGPTAQPLTQQVASGSLSYPGFADSAGHRATWSNNSSLALGSRGSAAVTRLEVGEYNSGTVYWSALFRVDDMTGLAGSQTTGVYVAGFNSTAGAQTGTITVAGARLVLRNELDGDNNPTGKFQFGTSVNSNQSPIQVFETTARNPGETYLLVGSYTFNPGSNDDVSRLWVNPDPSTFGAASPPTADLTSTGADMTIIRTFFLRQYSDNSAQSPALTSLDELRVDPTWAGVTPAVPEPTSLAGLAGLALCARRRR